MRREIGNNAYAKFGGKKQRVLWYLPKWPIGFLGSGIWHFLEREIRDSKEIWERDSGFHFWTGYGI